MARLLPYAHGPCAHFRTPLFLEAPVTNPGTRDLSERVESRRHGEIGASIVDGGLLQFLVDSEIRKAQRLRYCVSLIRMAPDSPLEETAGLSEPGVAERMARNLRSTDVIMCPPSTFTLLLVDADVPSLPSIIGRLTTALGIGWSAGGSCYPRTATRIEDLLGQAEDQMLTAQRDGGNRLHLPTRQHGRLRPD